MPRRRKGNNINGILLLDKPFGLSSNQALQRARYLLDAKKAGHTGSLDPYATGLLPLCFGEATKVSQFMLGQDKRYEVEILFGVETDSGDAEGKIINQQSAQQIMLSQIENVIPAFIGEIAQVPPMYSALKKDGQPLYKLARQGIEVERQPRQVTTYDIQILDWQPPRLTLNVACSSGFYIRSLAIDLGGALNNIAHVTALRRTQVGKFDLNQAVTIEKFEDLKHKQRVNSLLSPDKALQLPEIYLNHDQQNAFMLGQKVLIERHRDDALFLIYADSKFLGLGEFTADNMLKPRRIFNL